MAITSNDIKYYQSAIYADGPTTNGGRLSANLIPIGSSNDIFPAVSSAERTNGVTRWRKAFVKNEEATNLVAFNPLVAISKFTDGGDQVYFTNGTQRDTENQIPGTPRLYGGGYLTNSAATNDTSISVTVEDGTVSIFQAGDMIVFFDVANNQFWFVSLTGTPTVANNVWTVPVSVPSNFTGGLDANGNPNTYIASMWAPAGTTISSSNTAPVLTTTAGTLDSTQLALDNIGAIEQDWTITFTSATAFSVAGDTVGAIATGTTTADYAPTNPAFAGKPYFTIPAAAWGGTWAAGDTVTFTTSPAALPVWFKLVVPAGIAAATSNWQTLVSIDSP